MNKKINNVYDYADYRILLSDDFMARSANNYGYSLRAYSRDLSLSPGFLSDLLRGNKDLSPAKGRLVFSKLSFENEELDYIEKLIVFKSATDDSQKQDAHNYIESRFNRTTLVGDNSKDLILKSSTHFAVYGIVRKVNNLEGVYQFTDQLEMPRAEVSAAVQELTEHHYFIQKDNTYQVNDEKLTLTSHEEIIPVLKKFSTQMIDMIAKNGGIKPPEAVANGLVLGLNEQSWDLAVEAQKHFIKSLLRIANHPGPVDRFVMLSNIWLTVKKPSSSSQPLNS
ncbi:MAG: TIGR02147 family protein [Bdellovibrio sp.]|nr:TIGR02147 family protein [Bdellovibrio sp.]